MGVKRVGLLAAVAVAVMLAAPAASAIEPTPVSFTLSTHGTVSRGVTVKPVMKKRHSIGLVVFTQPKHAEVGTVPLGRFSGRPSIHWNLKVHGKTLGSGSYVISLRVFAHGRPTKIPPPPARKLTISGQYVRVT
jgi:hypothetical protein